MEYQILKTTSEDQILIVTISREKALNALNKQTMQELNHLFSNDIPKQKDIRGVILTGAGSKSFVAGADIKEFLGLSGDQGKELAQFGQDTFFAIERSKVPVVAVVNGFALGGGCELAMACHMRVAEPNARFGQPEVNLGLIPGYGGTQRLIQYIGKGKALELMLTADMINAEEAWRLGLVNHLSEPGEAMEVAKKLLLKISQKGPLAVQKVIESVNAYFAPGNQGFATEVNHFGETTRTEDFVEGANAFVEKRKANFKGA